MRKKNASSVINKLNLKYYFMFFLFIRCAVFIMFCICLKISLFNLVFSLELWNFLLFCLYFESYEKVRDAWRILTNSWLHIHEMRERCISSRHDPFSHAYYEKCTYDFLRYSFWMSLSQSLNHAHAHAHTHFFVCSLIYLI